MKFISIFKIIYLKTGKIIKISIMNEHFFIEN